MNTASKIKSTPLQYASSFINWGERKEALLKKIEKKEAGAVGMSIALMSMSLITWGYFFNNLNYAVVTIGLMLLSFFFFLFVMETKNFVFARKERRVLRELNIEMFQALKSDHAIMKDLAQLAVDATTQEIFSDIADNVVNDHDNDTWLKVEQLVEGYHSFQSQCVRTKEKNLALKTLGVNLAPAQPHEKDKLLSLL